MSGSHHPWKNPEITPCAKGRCCAIVEKMKHRFYFRDLTRRSHIFPALSIIALAAMLSSSRIQGADEAAPAAPAAVEPVKAEALPKAFVDGTGKDWRALGEADFTKVNCPPETWTFTKEGISCTGQPVGVIRSIKEYTNLELVVEWKHLKAAGNSGVFLWGMPQSIKELEAGKGSLPHGIEVQILDHGYTEQFEKSTGKKADWFTTNGDVFPTGPAKMKPFPPSAPGGSQRSFPSKNLSKGVGEWNHYYIRAINGEVRLWVNGEEVSGGTGCQPATGYLCLESEGSPIEFRNLRIRELP